MEKTRWFSHYTNNPDNAASILCFPYAGGSPSIFAGWTKFFNDDINLCPVLYPGREIRIDEPVPCDIKKLAHDFVKENAEIFLKPYGVLGYCAGGLTAYEVIAEAERVYGSSPVFFMTVSISAPEHKMDIAELCESTEDQSLIEYMIKHQIIDEETADDEDFLEYYIPIIRGDF